MSITIIIRKNSESFKPLKELTPLYRERGTLLTKFNAFYVKGLTFHLKF